jgi:hypothetical protein
MLGILRERYARGDFDNNNTLNEMHKKLEASILCESNSKDPRVLMALPSLRREYAQGGANLDTFMTMHNALDVKII